MLASKYMRACARMLWLGDYSSAWLCGCVRVAVACAPVLICSTSAPLTVYTATLPSDRPRAMYRGVRSPAAWGMSTCRGATVVTRTPCSFAASAAALASLAAGSVGPESVLGAFRRARSKKLSSHAL